jgi:MOSC domain-containing protein YiiM
MRKGKVVAVCVSKRKGVVKNNVGHAVLRVDWGIEGDAHAGPWHRQVSLLAWESIEKMRAQGLNVREGSFAENITTRGLELHTLPVGTRMRLGSALVEVTQIGKLCHTQCAIFQQVGDCVMPREGIFVRVLEAGEVAVGDEIEVLSEVSSSPGGATGSWPTTPSPRTSRA